MTSVTEFGSIRFSFFRPDAREVKVVGSFAGWVADGREMTSSGDGWWTTTLELAAGEYRFRYVADGHWFTDFAANGVELTKKGWNSILLVSEAVPKTVMRIRPELPQETEQNTTDAIAA